MRKGFTLLEVMISLVLLSMILLAITSAFVTSAKVFDSSITISEESSDANANLQNYLEDNTFTTGITTNSVVIDVNGVDISMEEIKSTQNNTVLTYYQ